MKAVLFDAFGTLVEIMDKRNPFVRAGASRSVMTQNSCLECFTDDRDLHRDLNIELQSIIVYDDVIPVLQRLRRDGIKIGVASNLARPYGDEVMRLLGEHVDMLHYSYLEGRMKPDPYFFHRACQRLDCRPGEVMMIGDSYRNDYCGAIEAGLSAAMITRRDGDRLDTLL